MSLIKSKNRREEQSTNPSKSTAPKPKSHSLKHPQPAYEAAEIHTESIMLPFANNEHIQFLTRNHSELSHRKEKSSRYNLLFSEQLTASPSPLSDYQKITYNRAVSKAHPNYNR